MRDFTTDIYNIEIDKIGNDKPGRLGDLHELGVSSDYLSDDKNSGEVEKCSKDDRIFCAPIG